MPDADDKETRTFIHDESCKEIEQIIRKCKKKLLPLLKDDVSEDTMVEAVRECVNPIYETVESTLLEYFYALRSVKVFLRSTIEACHRFKSAHAYIADGRTTEAANVLYAAASDLEKAVEYAGENVKFS